MAIAVFADLAHEDDVVEMASTIRRQLRISMAVEGIDEGRVGNLLRFVGQQERVARQPPALDGTWAPPTLDGVRLAHPGLLSPDVRAIRRLFPGSADLELGVLLAFEDLTDDDGHARFVADRHLVADALLGGCTGQDGRRRRRSPRRRRRRDGRQAENEIRRRLRAAVAALSDQDRRALEAALEADPHLWCRLALAQAQVFDIPDRLAGVAGTAVARQVAQLYFKESPELAQQAGVYVGGLVLGEVLVDVIGVGYLQSAAQAARVCAWLLCPELAEHQEVVDGLKTFARVKLEDSAVDGFFGWAKRITVA